MKLLFGRFLGANQAKKDRLVPADMAVSSSNHKPLRGDLRPWKSPSTVATVPASRQTIYRMGRDTANDSQYWLSWTTIVHAVRAPVPNDTTERTYFTGSGAPKWTDNTIGLTGTPYPSATRDLGVPTPTAVPTITDLVTGTSANNEVVYVVYTFVTDKGEESAPSPPSLANTRKTDTTSTIGNLANAPAGNYTIASKNIYITVSGETGETQFYFLRSISASSTSTTDDRRLRGDALQTQDWSPPDSTMTCLTALWNGMLAGIVKSQVQFSQAYAGYAWRPQDQYIPPDTKPVGLRVIDGQQLVVLTTGRPCVVSGSSPESMDGSVTSLAQACVSEQGAVSFGHGVAYPAPDGLAYLGANGAGRILTAGLMTREDWQALAPTTMKAGRWEGLYLCSYSGGGFIIDPLAPELGVFFLSSGFTACYFDEIADVLYLLNTTNVQKWDAGTALTVTWLSGVKKLPTPVSFECIDVTAGAYPVTVTVIMRNLTAAQVTKITTAFAWAGVTAYGTDGVQYPVSVTGPDPTFLPPIGMSDEWQVQISTTNDVQGVRFAESVDELSDE